MKPIIMSTDGVRAVIDGRKTMARMPMKPQPVRNGAFWELGGAGWSMDTVTPVYGHSLYNRMPHKPGDVLWVRETWARLYYVDPSGYTHFDHPMLFYRADGSPDITLYDDNGFLEEDQRIPWRSPVTMPREAARLFLRVKDVRVERVQDITVDDAGREGFEGFHHKNPMLGNLPEIVWNFQNEWDARNAKRGYGWDSNPLVWVIEFERITQEEADE